MPSLNSTAALLLVINVVRINRLPFFIDCDLYARSRAYDWLWRIYYEESLVKVCRAITQALCMIHCLLNFSARLAFFFSKKNRHNTKSDSGLPSRKRCWSTVRSNSMRFTYLCTWATYPLSCLFEYLCILCIYFCRIFFHFYTLIKFP